MRILIAAVGRLKAEERDLFARYHDRLDQSGRGVAIGPLELVELPESRAATAPLRMAEEAKGLVKASRSADFRIALDERGTALSSTAFAALVAAKRDGGARTCAFLVGGPDGHGTAAPENAGLTLSLGLMSLPHGLARVILAEQLYRAATILAGHPYHRA